MLNCNLFNLKRFTRILDDLTYTHELSKLQMQRIKNAYKVWRKFGTDLGAVGIGVAGTLTPKSNFRIFDAIGFNHIGKATLLDIGASDGFLLLLSSSIGYKRAIGIEVRESDALTDKFEAMKSKLVSVMPDKEFNTSLILGKDVIDFDEKTVLESGEDTHVYCAWEGFNVNDQLHTLEMIQRIQPTHAVFVTRGSRNIGKPELLLEHLEGYQLLLKTKVMLSGGNQTLTAVILRRDNYIVNE